VSPALADQNYRLLDALPGLLVRDCESPSLLVSGAALPGTRLLCSMGPEQLKHVGSSALSACFWWSKPSWMRYRSHCGLGWRAMADYHPRVASGQIGIRSRHVSGMPSLLVEMTKVHHPRLPVAAASVCGSYPWGDRAAKFALDR